MPDLSKPGPAEITAGLVRREMEIAATPQLPPDSTKRPCVNSAKTEGEGR
jgi:hypothetical protein